MKIIDLGSGSSSWNTTKLPVTGVDINNQLLKHGKESGNIDRTINASLDVRLPVECNFFDFVVMTEVIEHLHEPQKQIKEAHRILKNNGFLIVTVPLDTLFSAWRILFEIGCFLRGNIFGDEYFKNRCGHVQHFSIKSISEILENCDFSVIEKNITVLNIGLVAKK